MAHDHFLAGLGGGLNTIESSEGEDDFQLADTERTSSNSQFVSTRNGPARPGPSGWNTSSSYLPSMTTSRPQAGSSRNSFSSASARSFASSHSSRLSTAQSDRWSSRRSSAVSSPGTSEAPSEFTALPPGPPIVLPQIEGERIPCGLVGHFFCNETFEPQDRDSYVTHAMEHMKGRYPSYSKCPGCDDFSFEASQSDRRGGADAQYTFESRMSHIHDEHALGGPGAMSRPDYFLHRHLDLNNPREDPISRRPPQLNEGPAFLAADDIHPAGYRPPQRPAMTPHAMDRDERLYERQHRQQRGSRQAH